VLWRSCWGRKISLQCAATAAADDDDAYVLHERKLPNTKTQLSKLFFPFISSQATSEVMLSSTKTTQSPITGPHSPHPLIVGTYFPQHESAPFTRALEEQVV
jgi:hypothetical protein